MIAPAMSAGTAETEGLGAKPASAVRGAEAPASTSHPHPAGGAVEAGEASWPPLANVAEHIPLGFECRSCGGSAYNWLKKCARYEATGEGCCPDFRAWIRKARAGEPTIEQKRAAARALTDPLASEA